MKHELGVNMGAFCSDKPETTMEQLKETALVCRDSGFRYLDFETNYKRDDFEDRAKTFRAFLDESGMSVIQSHAPYNRYETYPDAEFPMLQDRCLTVASILGAQYLVVHGDEFMPELGAQFDSKKAVDVYYDRFAPLVERAKKLGVGIAFENLFEDGFKGRKRFCSTVEELKSLIERYNDPAVTCCWDFGHGRCSFGFDGCADALRQMGSLVTCTHVHDNRGEDDHLLPFLGRMNWADQIHALRDTGYQGYFTYEFVYLKFPRALHGSFLSHAHDVGEYILGL